MRVLVVKTSSMGDVIHTLPALTDAVRAIPTVRFDWVVEENFAQIPAWHPAVDRVIPVAIRRWRKSWFSQQHRQERQQFRVQLKQYHYDAIIDAQGLVKSALLVTRLASGSKHGFDRQSAREPLASWWFDKRHTVSKQCHAVERTRQLFASSLGYAKPEQLGDYAIIKRFLPSEIAPAERYVMALHATTRANKHWPEMYWRELLEYLQPYAVRVKLPWSSIEEHQRAQRLADGLNFVEILPRMSLQHIAATLAMASAVVSVDTGLSHLAAALNRPNITLYGPTSPGLIGGYGQHQHALVADDGILSSLTATRVLTHLLPLLAVDKPLCAP